MNQMKLKGCNRCGGDLFPDQSDREGRTLTCLQCGSEVTLRSVFARPAPTAALAPVAVRMTIGS